MWLWCECSLHIEVGQEPWEGVWYEIEPSPPVGPSLGLKVNGAGCWWFRFVTLSTQEA
jgi:hypothetical protein